MYRFSPFGLRPLRKSSDGKPSCICPKLSNTVAVQQHAKQATATNVLSFYLNISNTSNPKDPWLCIFFLLRTSPTSRSCCGNRCLLSRFGDLRRTQCAYTTCTATDQGHAKKIFKSGRLPCDTHLNEALQI